MSSWKVLYIDDLGGEMMLALKGSFTEFVHTLNCGQVSINISKPGITKGQHWHQTKWEQFIVKESPWNFHTKLSHFFQSQTDPVILSKVSRLSCAN